MPHRSKQKSFWKKFRSKYKLSFFNENTLEEVWTFRLSRLGAFLFLTLLVVAVCSATAFFIIGTPVKNYLPGYLKTEARVKIVDNALRIDSLTRAMHLKDAYLRSLKNILSGDINIDSVQQVSDSLLAFPVDSLLEKSGISAEFARKYEEEEKYTLNVFNNTIPTDGFIFYAPVKGPVKRSFDPAAGHFGVDVQPSRNAAVAAALDGTVVSASYTIECGYVIELQHSNDFISIYKYNSGLLKKTGDKVSGGEKIAVAGNDGLTGSGEPLVEFQIWHKGKALNPQEYITF